MIEKYRQREFKLKLAAITNIIHNDGPDTLTDVLLDIDNQLRDRGDSVWSYWANPNAFRTYLYDNRAELAEICKEIGVSSKQSTIEQISRLLYGGETIEGGSGKVTPAIRSELLGGRELSPDRTALLKETRHFIQRTLDTFAIALQGTEPKDIPALIERYTEVVMAAFERK